MASSSQTKDYAVVQFLSDSTYSEVPTNGLQKMAIIICVGGHREHQTLQH